MDTKKSIPRVLTAALRGGGGKTVVSVGLAAAWRARGLHVAPFKKGPDYIDAAWLAQAAGQPCRNLDLFLMEPDTIRRSFSTVASAADLALVEGNRGLYDGIDAAGTYSSAQLARLLECPVVVVADCTKSTGTVGAMVLGLQKFDPEVPICGVILNQVAGRRHEGVLRETIERACGLPILGMIPRIPDFPFPERHLGLVPPQEHGEVSAAVQQARELVEKQLDLEAILRVARAAPEWVVPAETSREERTPCEATVRIGVIRDEAFQFYYPENLEALEAQGAALIEISALNSPALPEVDALYLGGGFPETRAAQLSANVTFRESVRRAVEEGLPVYAECGGVLYLGKRLLYNEDAYPLVGVFPVDFVFSRKPRGHGYTILETVAENPFFTVGDTIRGHEFHYAQLREEAAANLSFAFGVRRGYGFDGRSDGLCHRNVLASLTHVHALGVRGWAESLVRQAACHKEARASGQGRA